MKPCLKELCSRARKKTFLNCTAKEEENNFELLLVNNWCNLSSSSFSCFYHGAQLELPVFFTLLCSHICRPTVLIVSMIDFSQSCIKTRLYKIGDGLWKKFLYVLNKMKHKLISNKIQKIYSGHNPFLHSNIPSGRKYSAQLLQK